MNNLLRINIRSLIPIIRKVSLNINTINQPSQAITNHQFYCTTNGFPPTRDQLGSDLLDLVTYETVSGDTLESLWEYFEDLVESSPHLRNADINYSDGVLTINFGKPYGTYVINRQSPNRQIWLSSPTSGPKRYDYIPIENDKITKGYWLYRHDQGTLHELLQQEIEPIINKPVDFFNLPYGTKSS